MCHGVRAIAANIAKLPELLRKAMAARCEAAPKFFLVPIPVTMMAVAMMVAVAVAMRRVAVTGVHRLLGRCGTR